MFSQHFVKCKDTI